jgi:predicted regulator of Ras-like GTPase activity (Roadblock/LC7/MglB family)
MLGLMNPWVWVQTLPQTLPPLLEDVPALEAFLRERLMWQSEIIAIAVLAEDGALIAQCQMPDGMAFVYRMCAAQVALGRAMCEATGRGEATEFYLRLPEGYIIMTVVAHSILMILMPRNAKL